MMRQASSEDWWSRARWKFRDNNSFRLWTEGEEEEEDRWCMPIAPTNRSIDRVLQLASGSRQKMREIAETQEEMEAMEPSAPSWPPARPTDN
ncbi:unnamed protein product [Calypogeia fissa]